MATALDVLPLITPMPPSAVQAWRAKARASGAPWATLSASQIIGLVFTLLVCGFMVLVFGGVIGGMVLTSFTSGNPLPGLFSLVLGAAIVVLCVVIVRAAFRSTGRWARWARIDAFAQANGLVFSPSDTAVGLPGLIFGLGSDRRLVEHVHSPGGRIDMGGYTYTTGSGKSRTTHRWSYLAIRLDRRLPNMVLDSRENNRLLGSNLPIAFARDQVLHLEGDFDKYFTLYCPKDYETDALYVFTPDLMALLIDEAAPFDVEIVDDWFLAYASTPLDMSKPETYGRLFRIVDTVGAKTLDQTERYRDDRVPDAIAANVVAPQGARLRHGVSIGAVIGVVVVVGWIGWAFLSNVSGLGR
jgi:hypothetical protein